MEAGPLRNTVKTRPWHGYSWTIVPACPLPISTGSCQFILLQHWETKQWYNYSWTGVLTSSLLTTTNQRLYTMLQQTDMRRSHCCSSTGTPMSPLLISSGARQPPHVASERGFEAVTRLLLDKGANFSTGEHELTLH